MDTEKLLKILAVVFVQRANSWYARKGYEAASVAYSNAYDWLCYCVHHMEDCLLCCDGVEDAKNFVEEHPNLDVWDYEEVYEKEKAEKNKSF